MLTVSGSTLAAQEIYELLHSVPWQELQARAEETLLRNKGRHVFVRGLIEFSNICRRNCQYCGLRFQNKSLARYSLGKEEILACATQAVAQGADTIVLQSGENAIDAHWLADVVETITGRLHVPVTLSVGERPYADYALWHEAGAKRYLLKHETADAMLYARLHAGYSLKGRVQHLRWLADIGYEVGSGFMVGLPGQSRESLVEDILLVQRLGVAMCGVGPFIPQADTPLAHEQGGSASMTLRVMAVLRLALPNANIPATTALASIDSEQGQANGLRAGGNVLMPGFTPAKYREQYRIYDNKNRVDMDDARTTIEAAGRTHSLKTTENKQKNLLQPGGYDGQG